MLTEESRQKAVDIHDRDAQLFEEMYSGRPDGRSEAFRYGRKHLDRLLQPLIEQLPAGAAVLDVGCGTGELVDRLRRAGLNATGVEPAPEMRRLAQERVPAAGIRDGTLLDLPFADNSFEFVTAMEVFRYLSYEDNQRGLREVFRVLKPGGVFFGTFVNLLALDGFALLVGARWLRQRLGLGALEFHTEFELPETLRRSLLAAGFSSAETRGVMFAPLRVAFKAHRSVGKTLARLVDPLDAQLSDGPLASRFAGHLVAIARKG